ncbi:MAG: three-Cys-motif partner protein TcmP [Melioribacteraceae bacterium]
MKKKINAKTNRLEHSKAKVELYSTYLATFLNILSRVNFIDKIFIYDLMCGEGIYEDGGKGSPILTLETIKNHYFSNKKQCPDIEILFNDKDKSEIEKDKYKIERVQAAASTIFLPFNVDIKYSKEDYNKIFPRLIKNLREIENNNRILIFLDPYGYKEIKPEHIKEIIGNKKTELLLFLPISHMYRFCKKSLSKEDFPGGVPLEKFLLPLIEFNTNLSIVKSVYDFIFQLKESFKGYLSEYNIFVETFTIERDSQNVYSLFFFTHHIRGFEKMLESKWKMDKQQGRGFRFNSDEDTFFSEVEMSDYVHKLKEFVSSNIKTNADLYLFGLENGFLPRDTNKVLKEWQNKYPNFKVYLQNKRETRKGSFYLGYEHHNSDPKKIVTFIFE